MLEEWILSQIEPLRERALIIVRDPQRLIRPGAYVVDGWAEQHGFSVMLCTGNLALREMWEFARDDGHPRTLLVDRSRTDAKLPLFYPDLDQAAGPGQHLNLSLRDFLIERTGDPHWPKAVDDRTLSGLLLADLEATLQAYRDLRAVHSSRFTDSDLYRLVLGATLKINPFRSLSIEAVRRICLEQHGTVSRLRGVLPPEVLGQLERAIADAPKPFCWLLEREPAAVMRAFTLAAMLHQHGLDYRLLLSNLDPSLYEYRDIQKNALEAAMREQLGIDPDQVRADVLAAEAFLKDAPQRLHFLLHEQLQLDDPQHALAALQREKLSPLIREMALAALLSDLLTDLNLGFHQAVRAWLDEQAASAENPVLRRSTETWNILEALYRRAYLTLQLSRAAYQEAKIIQGQAAVDLDILDFHRIWNERGANRLDYYLSSLERSLRLGEALPLPQRLLWPTFLDRWQRMRDQLKNLAADVERLQDTLNRRFQDLYRLRYGDWITQDDSPLVFTHQFLRRLVQAHWDPQSGRKAVILIFDGLRTDAWDELLRPVLEERYTIIADRPGSALLPTETQLSRKAISAGCLPDQFAHSSEQRLLELWLQQWLGRPFRLEVIKNDDTVASGMSVQYTSPLLDVIIFNFSDKNLHDNPSELALIYDTSVQAIIRADVRAALRELPDDALIFVTSDHGFTPVPTPTVVIGPPTVDDAEQVKYRNARAARKPAADQADKVIEFDARRLHLPPQPGVAALLFPRPGYTLKRPRGPHKPDKYSHGGLSLAECFVPMVVLGPRPREHTLWQQMEVRQIGSVSEGEALTLAIKLTTTRPVTALPLSLRFSRDDLPERREFIYGDTTEFHITWQPGLDITPEQRQQAELALPLTVTVMCQEGGQTHRLSRSLDLRLKLDPQRLHRRVDASLNKLMGLTPKGLRQGPGSA